MSVDILFNRVVNIGDLSPSKMSWINSRKVMADVDRDVDETINGTKNIEKTFLQCLSINPLYTFCKIASSPVTCTGDSNWSDIDLSVFSLCHSDVED